MKKINIRRFNYRLMRDYLTFNNIMLVIALLIAASWVWGSLQMMQRNYTLQKKLDDKSRQLVVSQLDMETAKLEQRYFKTDEYKELAVRENLGLVSPGESVIILPENSEKVKQESANETTTANYNTSSVAQETKSNLEQWADFLFGNNNSKSL